MRASPRVLFCLPLIALALAGCGPAALFATPTPSATATVEVTLTLGPSATPTDTPYPTWTPVPTATPTITPTPTPAPTATPMLSLCETKLRLPEASAAGKLRVAWIRAGNVWLWNEGDGQGAALTETGDARSVRLSSDGALAAYERAIGDQAVEIWVVGADGKDARRLAGAEDLLSMGHYDFAASVLPHNLTWIPGTHALAFNTQPVYVQSQPYAADDLWTIDADTGEAKALLEHRKGGEFVISPDGAQIALMTPNTFSLIASDGTDLRWNILKSYHALEMAGAYFYPRPAWAADSQSLRVGVPNPDDVTAPNPRIDVWEIPLRGFDLAQVGSVQAFPPSLAFSPDLSVLAYISWPEMDSGRRELRLATLAGQNTQTALYAAGGRLEFLGWAPGSRDFAFWVPASRRLQRGDACGTPEPLGETQTDYGALRWVDDERFLFVSGAPGAWALQLSTGGADQQLAELGDVAAYDFALVGD